MENGAGLKEIQEQFNFGNYIPEIISEAPPKGGYMNTPKDIVSKSNDFVRYRLISAYPKDPIAPRLFACMVSCCHNRKDEKLNPCNVHVKDFMPWSETGKDYAKIKNVMKVLRTMLVEVETDGEYVIDTLLDKRMVYNRKTGMVTAQLNPAFGGFFLNLYEKYTSYALIDFTSLRSYYSQRLFEIACSIAPQTEETFPLAKLQRMLDITKGSLLTYGNFKQKVLEPSKKEINENTGMKFDYDIKKMGRSVAFIIIKAQRKKTKFRNNKSARHP